MKKRNIAIIQMYVECGKCMEVNAGKIAGYAPLVTAAGNLSLRITEIQEKEQQVDAIIKAYTIDKKAKLIMMANLANVLRKKVQAVMLSKNDVFGYEKVNVPRRDIMNAAALTAISRAQNIYDMGAAISPADKTTFQITDDELEVLQAAIESFKQANADRRFSAVVKQNAGVDLDGMIRSTSSYIRTTMNSLMGNYELSDSSFFNEWMLAQRIMDPAQHHAQITGMVTDQENLQPLQMVKVKATSGERIYEDMTDSEGKYKLPVNPEVWNVTFELPTYITKDKTNIIVDSGEKEILNVSLTPASV